MKNRITAALATILTITMMTGLTAFAATEPHDYNVATNTARTYGEITFQTPNTWGDPTATNDAFLWTIPEGYIMLSYTALAGINPLVITNDEIVAVPLTMLAAMNMSATNIQLGMLPADNRNTCIVTATGAVNNIPGTCTYAIVNSATGIYSLQYFASTASDINRTSDVTQMMNSMTFTGSAAAVPTTATATATGATSGSSRYLFSWADWKTAEEALYQEYTSQKNAIRQKYRSNYAARSAALDSNYTEYQNKWHAAYDYYHQTR